MYVVIGASDVCTLASRNRRAVAIRHVERRRPERATGANGLTRQREQHLGLVDVADAGHDALVEQHVGDRLSPAARLHAPQRLRRVEALSQQVGAEPAQLVVPRESRGGDELRHRHVEADRDEVRGRDDDRACRGAGAATRSPGR